MTEKRKFFFDLNNFNDDAEELSEEELAFREKEAELIRSHGEEIKRIKDSSYAEGKKDGYEESRHSLEQKIALLLETSKQSFLELQAHESDREKRYETEANILTLAVLQKIYPSWATRFGIDEIEAGIRNVLQRASNQKSIIIEVTPTLREEVERRLLPLQDTLAEISFSVQSKDGLSEDDFLMKWDDGGAVRDGAVLADQILQELKQGEIELPQENLAETPETRQNESSDSDIDPSNLPEVEVDANDKDITRSPESPNE